jgi:hypothetical protein
VVLTVVHYHPTCFNVVALEDLDIRYPVEYLSLLAVGIAHGALGADIRRRATAVANPL